MDQIEENEFEKICARYKLSKDEHDRISRNINEIMLNGKTSSERPIAIIDIAPPGSGKTGLNGMALNQFSNCNACIINSDELKPFHPKIDEIAKQYPHYYTKITNQESNSWTDCLFETAVDGNYNIIFEGTGRNLKLLQKMLNKMKNYKIIIRGMAVNELNCLMSIIERYEGQVNEKGWGRLVTIDHFYKAYSEMLETIDGLEKLRIADSVEVYMRGEKPSEPTKIYSSKTKEYQGVRQAVIVGRQLDKKNALNYFDANFKNQIHLNENFAEQDILKKIEQLYNSNCIEK